MGPVAGAQQIYQLKGLQGFYFGLPAVLLQVAGKGAIRFTAFEQFKFLMQLAPVPKASIDFLAGIGAGFAEAFLWTTPTERLKVLRQNDIKSGLNRYSSLVGSIRTVATEHGITGLYAGIGATGIRQASGVGVRFALYGRVKSALTSDPPQMWQSAVAGGITGCCSTLLNNPIDVIKSRIEAQDGKTKEYTGTIQAFRAILKQEGWKKYWSRLDDFPFAPGRKGNGLANGNLHQPWCNAFVEGFVECKSPSHLQVLQVLSVFLHVFFL